MVKIPSLPENPLLLDIFKRFRTGLRPLLELHDAILRSRSPLTEGERELIAAYVSGLNQCDYCYDAHMVTAKAFGIDAALIKALIEDPETAPVSDHLKPILSYVRKLTLTPTRLTQKDVDAVLESGCDDEALYSAVSVCALFNYMNRIVEGMGVVRGPHSLRVSPEVLKGSHLQILDILSDDL